MVAAVFLHLLSLVFATLPHLSECLTQARIQVVLSENGSTSVLNEALHPELTDVLPQANTEAVAKTEEVLQELLSDSSSASEVSKDVVTAHDLQPSNGTVGLPINSAEGLHHGLLHSLDPAIVTFFLVLPIVGYIALTVWETGETPWAYLLPKRSDDDHIPITRMASYVATSPANGKNGSGPTSTFSRSVSMGEAEEEAEPKEGTIFMNLLSGLVIAFGCLPEAISFALIVGVSPLNGIWAGIFMGFYTSLLGGRPGSISCASASTAIVMVEFTRNPILGVGALALCPLICGVVEVLIGALHLARFVTLVPHPVMLGFANGLAIVIAKAQIDQFREGGHNTPFVPGPEMWGMILTAAVSMLSAMAFPRIPRVGKLLPGPLVGMVAATVFGLAVNHWLPMRTLAHVAGEHTFRGGLETMPPWDFPPANVNYSDMGMWSAVISTALRMSVVAIVESLLTLLLVDQITDTTGSTTKESIGQGLGNIVSGLFGLQGGCALIGQTLINVGGGGKGRLSSFAACFGLLIFTVALAPIVGKVPIAALVGLMFLVSVNTFVWGSLQLFKDSLIEWTDGVVIIMVTAVTVWKDLAIAVIAGLLFSALVLAWKAAKQLSIKRDISGKSQMITISGLLFFGSAMQLPKLIDASEIQEEEVTLCFEDTKVLDHSAMDAIVKVQDKLEDLGKKVALLGLPEDARTYIEALKARQ
mmetsp:Transcript_64454/g.153839  ORF Transcript_64454/g.153839 Transcript_64454/m.153839 type:complete len:701 (-) Transcript_64454:206-2308(-)|eukprot:CAMPEP_0178424398 /NCGR_PEP_ID=MMETSP0689_2-20121128/28188_1 /TAXON_ID=160604 /ORGANISM="Amphidinium massartii, Strain CS-259" /LENGTH=700 /DNA_ID=CAMNT_0020046031 /DNA_START=87 /DNA_END=2189 /DNA_ORIENTATION=+